MVGRERDLIISDGRFTTQLEQECPGLEARIRLPGQDMNPAVAHVLRDSWGSRGSVSRRPTARWRITRPSLWRRPAWHWSALTGQVEALRQIKDESEIAAIREAIRFAERAFQMLRAGLREGETEKETADALEGYLRRCGATAASFPPIVAVGANSALPHARPTATTRIGQDDFVLIDWGATGRPYKSDLTRSSGHR